MSGSDTSPATRVTDALASLVDRIAGSTAELIRVPSVNPSYPGQQIRRARRR